MTRSIHIEPVLNGFVCKVGCQTVVFNSTRTLVVAVEQYFTHPEETEERFRKEAVNRTIGEVPQPPNDCRGEPRSQNMTSVAEQPCGLSQPGQTGLGRQLSPGCESQLSPRLR